MADRTQRLAIVVTAQDLASGKLGLVRKELAAMGPAGRVSALGLGLGITAARKGEQAFRHLGDRVRSLAGPIGLLGLTGAAFGVSGALEEGIRKASDWGLSIEKLGGLTSNTAEQLSGLLGITEKYGISNERIAQIVGFTEKTLGKLETATAKSGKATKSAALAHLELVKAQRVANGESTTTINKLIAEQKARDELTTSMANAVDGTTKLAAMQKTYGVQLTDSKGKALDFQSILLNVADAYSKATTASDKAKAAALSAAVFGRGYADLLPILKLGRKGILDAEQAAKDLGLTLSSQNVADLAKFREATREAGDAVSGLELQFGLLVMPDITDALKTGVEWMKTHRADIEGFFKSALHGAEALASFVTGTVVPTLTMIGGAAKSAWDAIPAPLRDVLAKGFVADRTIHFLFGMSPGGAIGDVLKGGLERGLAGLATKIGLGGVFQRGGSPASPMFVSDVAGGLGGGAGAAAGAWSKVGSIIGKAFLVVAVAQLADMIQQATGSDYASNRDLPLNQLSWPWGPKNTPKLDLGPFQNILGGDSGLPPSTGGKSADDMSNPDNPLNILMSGTEKNTGRAADDIAKLPGILDALHQTFKTDLDKLIHARTPADIAAAAKRVGSEVAKGVGNLATTNHVLATLRAKLNDTHDPKTQAVLRQQIAAVERKVVGREYVQRQITEARRVAASSESIKQKTAELKVIEGNLRKRGDINAANQVARLITIANNVLLVRNAIGGLSSTTEQNPGKAKDDTTRPKGSTPSNTGSPNSANGRADGGMAYPGHIYQVNERRGEFFEPVVPTRIHSNAPGLMSAGAARAIMVQLHVTITTMPKVVVGLRQLQEQQKAQARLGKVSAS